MPDAYTGDTGPGTRSAFWPVLLLAVAVLTSMAWQWNEIRHQHNQLKQQAASLEPVVKQALAIEGGVQRFFADVVALASADPEARAIADKYQIRPAAAAQPPAKTP